MEDLEIIQIGDNESSGLIIILPYEFEKIKLMSHLKDLADEYFISNIDKIYFTNKKELKKENGYVLEFLKK